MSDLNKDLEIKKAVKRSDYTTLFVKIGEKEFFNKEASTTFIEVVEYISEEVGIDKFISDNISSINGRKIIGFKKEEFTLAVKRLKPSSVGGFLINTHTSTEDKKNILEYLIKFYDIEGTIEVRNRAEIVVASEIETIEIETIEIESDEKTVKNSVINTFGADKNTSSICVLGKSGSGKTYRIEKTLEKEGHSSEVIIPSSSTTNLLVQYTKGDYVLSRLGNLILKANSDKSHYYTVVFDECHKYIEMINDELLQCISTKRNDGLRFISLDPVTDKLFNDLPEKNGRRIISDNLGFIFISSKEEIIRDNSDFYNRIDIISIDKSDRDIDFTIKVIKDKIESREDEEYSM